MKRMFASFIVIYSLIVVASATSPIMLSECGTLETNYASYQLANNIVISDKSSEFVCFDIKGNGITLDGNGFSLSSTSNELLQGTGVQYSGKGATVKNLRVANFRTGILAAGKFGKVEHNTITRATSGIDVTATNNEITNNVIGDFNSNESTSGIYVYFPARDPVASYINITNNVISNIQGESFVLGISVYYATFVNIANNHIFNLVSGESKGEEISVINGNVETYDNVFTAPVVEDVFLPSTALLLSCVAVLASALWFFRDTTPAPVPIVAPPAKKEEEKEKEKEKEAAEAKPQEGEESYEPDGADMIKSTFSFSVGSSPPTQPISL